MSEARKIGAKIVLDGEKEYREALKNINTAQKELRSEMKLSVSQYADAQNSLDALNQKVEIYTKQIDNQEQKIEIYTKAVENSSKKQEDAKKKVDLLTEQYEKASKELEEMKENTSTSNEELEKQEKKVSSLKNELNGAVKSYNAAERSVSSWQTSLNNAKADLATMEANLQKTSLYMEEAKHSTDGYAVSIDNLGKEVAKVEKDTQRFGDVFKANLASEAVTSGIGKVIDLVKEVGQELLGAVDGAAAFADEIATLSVQTGVSTSILQELTYAQELMDVSVDTVTNSMAKNIKSMSQAQKGSQDYAEAYKKLNVQVTTTNGQLRNSEEVYWEVIDALGNIANETERDAVAMTLFGKKAQDLNTLIALGSEGFAEYAKEAHEVGYVMDDEMMSALLDTSDAMERMNNKITAAKNQIGAELAPAIEEGYERIGNAVIELSDDITDFAEDAIPKVVGALEWILENSDAVLSAATGLGTAIAVNKYGGNVADTIHKITDAWKIYSATTENATVVTWLLNAAQNASPILKITAAIIALTGAVVAYNVVLKDEIKNGKQMTKNFEELIEKIRESESAYQSIASEIGNEKVKNEALIKTLVELSKIEEKTATQKQQVMDIVEELNTSMENLNIIYDEETDSLSRTTDELEKYNEALAAQRQYEENVSRMNELLVERETIQNSLTEAEENYCDVNAKFLNLNLSSQIGKLNDELERNVAEYEELEQKCSTYNSQLQILNETQKTGIDVTVQYKDMQYTIVDTTQEVADSISALTTAYDEACVAAYDSISSQVGLFDELVVKSDLTAQQMVTNLETQTESFKQYTEDLNVAAQLMSTTANPEFEKIVQSLMDMGTDGAGYLHELVTAAQEDSATFGEILSQFGEMETAKEKLADTIGDLQTNYTAGMEELLGIQLAKNEERIQNEQETAEEIERIVTESGDKVVEDVSMTMTDMNTTIIEGIPLVEESMINVANSMIQITNSALGRLEGQVPKFKEIGKGVMEDLANGISGGRSLVSEALQQSVQEAVDSMDISGLADRIDRRLGEALS